jgi:uncharacterized SAM-binding protein YcdF (DUF218 family)
MLAVDAEKAAKTMWRRRAMLGAALLLLLYWLLPLTLNFLATCLVRQDALIPSDIAVSLGGGQACTRHLYAAELYRRGLAKKVILTGLNFTRGESEEIQTRRYLTGLGIADADIFLLKDVRNTRREADALAQLMHDQGWKSALIVTDPYHTRRACYTIQRAGPDLRFAAAPLPPGPLGWKPERWWSRRGDMYATVRELLAWVNTLAGGLR